MPSTAVEQGALTVIVEVAPGKTDLLIDFLAKKIGKYVDGPQCPINFSELKTVHFMRWVVLREDKDASGKPTVAQLVLSTNYDLPREVHLRELIAVGAKVMEEIYSHCVGYAMGQDLFAFLSQSQFNYTPNAFYVGTRGLSVEMIKREQRFREEIENFLDRRVLSSSHSDDPLQQAAEAKSLRVSIQAFVMQREDLRWASQPEDPPQDKLKYYKQGLSAFLVALIALFVVAPIFTPLRWWVLPLTLLAIVAAVIVVGVVWYRKLRADEQKPDEAGDPIKINVDRIKDLVDGEDHLVQNQLTHLANVKPRRLRLSTLRLVLALINFLARTVFVRGELGGIPTIHFARWVIIDGGRRVLFFSNYDGSWVNYLGDFIDKAAPGLTAIWSNTVGCPKARGLYGDGATDEQRFKSWTRDHQLVTQVWYSAYEDLTVDNINNNHKLRIGLFAELGPAEERHWLSLL
jgi:hypothetical protein